MQVFKFGGASINSANAIRNMANIVRQHYGQPLVVVVSAMGKTTNLLERLVPSVFASEQERLTLLEQCRTYHTDIAAQLLPAGDATFQRLQQRIDELDQLTRQAPTSYNFDYDQIVAYGELISTTLIAGYLDSIGLNTRWIDIRRVIRTDANHREATVDFDATRQQAQQIITPALTQSPLVITQGFIAATQSGHTTTLGREGSDYSASILSYCLDADAMTIWKDVPGFLNADPKYFHDTVKINKIPFNEAIELAYYGASVIHPKTVKPIQNKGILLNVKSFLQPEAPGSVIGPFSAIEPLTPLYIFKTNQLLISIQPKDFSFIAEDNLQTIFATLATLNIRVNLMQLSALSFSFCINHNEILLQQLQQHLAPLFHVRYNTGLELITIRYYNQSIIDQIVAGRLILLQQRSRNTIQLLVEGTN